MYAASAGASKRKRTSSEQVVPGIAPDPPFPPYSTASRRRVSSRRGPPPPAALSGSPFQNVDYPIPNFQSVYSRMRDTQTGLKLADRRWRFLTYSKCFVGSEAVEWMVQHLECDRAAGVEMGQRLMDAGIIFHVTKSEPFADDALFYRFQEDDDTNILNMKRVWDSSIPTRAADVVAKDLITRLALLCEEHRKHILATDPDSPTLHQHRPQQQQQQQSQRSSPNTPKLPQVIPTTALSPLVSTSPPLHTSSAASPSLTSMAPSTPQLQPPPFTTPLLSIPVLPQSAPAPPENGTPVLTNLSHLSDDVDYSTLARSDRFREYSMSAAELQRVQLLGLNHDERIAFFVNVYNALCLHAHVVHGPPNSVLRRYTFFRALSYRVAGLDLSLDDIEHGILRGNKRPPMIKFVQQLRPSDPKVQHVITKRDMRIHFVISAGTKSDPPIRILDGDNVQEELHEATVDFLSYTVKVDLERRKVTLPRIMYWYSDDFPTPEKKLLLWVAQYLPQATSAQLVELVNGQEGAVTVTHENFDWGNAEARFNSSVVRRKRRRLERERSSVRVSGEGGVLGPGSSGDVRLSMPGDK